MTKLNPMASVKKILLFIAGVFYLGNGYSQPTFPVNGVAEPKERCYAFTHATIVKDAQRTLSDATMIIRKGKIIEIGTTVTLPKDAVTIDCKGKYIYPSFIDIYSDYGIMPPQRAAPGSGFDFRGPGQITSNTKGAFDWNQAIKPETEAFKLFAVEDTKATTYREAGFGTVLTHVKDGIARGTGAVVTLATENENLVMLKEKASANYSFSKGTSSQSYPSSLMGTIALLRQSYLDAQWYKSKPASEGVNISLQAWTENQSLPQVFDASDKWQDIRADRIGDEFGVQYIIKAGGNEYQRIKEVAATKATFIVPLNFPEAFDVEDPNDARFISLGDMKHWEMAPSNPAAFEKANIPFCLTASDLRDVKQFPASLRKAFDYGLTEARAFDALTRAPAILMGIYDQVGSLEAGKLANFLITSGPIFNEKTSILQNWVQGWKYAVNEDDWTDIKGLYNLTITPANGNSNSYNLLVKSAASASVIAKDTLTARFNYTAGLIKLSFSTAPGRRGGSSVGNANNADSARPAFAGGGLRGAAATGSASMRLSGTSSGAIWQGNGEDSAGVRVQWTAVWVKAAPAADSARRKQAVRIGKVKFPFDGYGWDSLPKQQTILLKNATVWTGEKEGRLQNTDVLLKNGKIAQVGKNLTDAYAKIIDATGKIVTAGIIDEHSHIAAASINEAGQSVTSEVRIADNLNPEDVNIYRQLSGGVTTSHILHGSANTIGGQTQLIKLRWGVDDDALKFKGADPFIKFALGENVKRTTSQSNNRFPDTRMGVEQVLMDAFQRAKDYEKAMSDAAAAGKKKGAAPVVVRRDLELDALVEILNKKRFITAHSYLQSEILMLMRVAEKFDFRVNTFTHVLEGYKVADKLKAHGANVSTFSDWWAYKMEVQDAIPYNAALMQQVGLNVCINSDDAEMARRLNQEAAKTIKYGGLSEDDAWRMVTINPAIALHVSDKVGSIKTGKDADVVVWSDNPLSIYAKPEQTIVDGIIYFDKNHDLELRRQITAERNRLVQKMLGEKRSGAPVLAPVPTMQVLLSCGDHQHRDGLTTIELEDVNDNN
jgi:imidazolonepropionase-like amidohydrolase